MEDMYMYFNIIITLLLFSSVLAVIVIIRMLKTIKILKNSIHVLKAKVYSIINITNKLENILYNDIEELLLKEMEKIVKYKIHKKTASAEGVITYFRKQAKNIAVEYKRLKTQLFDSNTLDVLYNNNYKSNVIPKAEPLLRDCYTFTVNDTPYTYPQYFMDAIDKINEDNYNEFRDNIRSKIIFTQPKSADSMTVSAVIIQIKHIAMLLYKEGVIEICKLYEANREEIEKKEKALKQLENDSYQSGIHDLLIKKEHLIELLEKKNIEILSNYLIKLAKKNKDSASETLIRNAKLNYIRINEQSIISNSVPNSIEMSNINNSFLKLIDKLADGK